MPVDPAPPRRRAARRAYDTLVHVASAPFLFVMVLVLYVLVASPAERFRAWRQDRGPGHPVRGRRHHRLR